MNDTADAPSSIDEPVIKEKSQQLVCEMCGGAFSSRNLLFAHLRDPASGCGNAIVTSGQSLPEAPSLVKKKAKKERYRIEMMERRRQKRLQARTAQYADASSSVWIGDLPLKWTRMGGKYRRLRALLRCYIPRDTPQPWIKVCVRKAYRKKTSDSQGSKNEKNSIGDKQDYVKGEYLGYAIVVFRDAQEARHVMKHMDGITVNYEEVWRANANENVQDLVDGEPFQLKIRPVDNGDSYEAKANTDGSENKADQPEKNRREVQHSGRPVPPSICSKLLSILTSLRWAVPNHRKGLAAERYLVLQTKVKNDLFYNDLREACKELMDWADPEYFYSGIAVTKNFVSSPHIDDKDQTYQYAISLGDFEGGGELCVEGHSDGNEDAEPDIVNVVNTHNRLARVDGRNCHWVKPWSNGTRYSLIFYDTTEQHKTPLNRSGVDVDYLTKA